MSLSSQLYAVSIVQVGSVASVIMHHVLTRDMNGTELGCGVTCCSRAVKDR
jgi:hypothetical protein